MTQERNASAVSRGFLVRPCCWGPALSCIRLSGFIPNKEIKIKYTGLRPGEKLYEELFDESEKIVSTVNDKFQMAIPEIPSHDTFVHYIAQLEGIVRKNDFEKVVPAIQKIVPNFQHEQISSADYGLIVEQ